VSRPHPGPERWKQEHQWLIVGLEVSGWLVLLFTLGATFVAGPTMLSLLPTWLVLVAIARILAGQHIHASRLQRAMDRLEDASGGADRRPRPPR
jgi:hypothetical protein